MDTGEVMYGKCIAVVVSAATLAGCGKSGATNEPAAGAPAQSTGAVPANVSLQGQYVDGIGQGLFFTPDGGVGVIGSRDNGRYVGQGQTFRVEMAGKPAAMGYVFSPDKISLSYPNDPRGTLYLFREGSDLAAQARAEANHTPIERKAPAFDRSVPLDRYVDLSPDNTAEGLYYLYAALHEPPLSDDEKFRMLSPHRAEADAFKRRDLVQAEMPGIDAKLADWKSKRYLRVTVNVPVWMSANARSDNGFPPMSYAGGFGLNGPYDFQRKGFPASCIANERISHALPPGWSGGNVGLVMGREETYRENCILLVPDEATARALEAKRSSGIGLMLKSATLYFYAVGDREGGGSDDVSVVLTHARLQYGDSVVGGAFTSDPPSVGAPIEVDFPQPALD